jgi:hypothetical protein
VSERQLVRRLFNGAVDVWEAQGTRARDQVQESEKESRDRRPAGGSGNSPIEPSARQALAAETGRRATGEAPPPRPARLAQGVSREYW